MVGCAVSVCFNIESKPETEIILVLEHFLPQWSITNIKDDGNYLSIHPKINLKSIQRQKKESLQEASCNLTPAVIISPPPSRLIELLSMQALLQTMWMSWRERRAMFVLSGLWMLQSSLPCHMMSSNKTNKMHGEREICMFSKSQGVFNTSGPYPTPCRYHNLFYLRSPRPDRPDTSRLIWTIKLSNRETGDSGLCQLFSWEGRGWRMIGQW